ncbi:DUF2971 domain-containing protein [Flavobacterium sp. '19STA2R22 D10 B1']|uniref:DUF2971 domain-containing protein n=1 Tax=Flavobacterium aerium TaxID=3037261 RepID=UPI00278C6ACB|nr:DUF2971 domain-containing protein [Flavobacterium sp. '19STA2R22 D10 B1']
MTKNYAENYPKIIYKYRSWSNKYHKDILLKNQVYLSSPIEFNDPFDCKIPKNFLLINTPEKVEKYVNDVIERQKDFIISKGLSIENEIIEYAKTLQNIQKFQKEREEIEFPMIDNHYGVLCMSAKWNSILMWSHYGDYHKGFCIGFNEEKMRESGLFGKGGPVTYSENFPIINPLDNEDRMIVSFYQTYYKSVEWSYEEEYRFTNLMFPEKPSNEMRIKVFAENCIEEINLGVNIEPSHKEEIIVEAKKRNIKIYQLIKIPFKFEFDRIEI